MFFADIIKKSKLNLEKPIYYSYIYVHLYATIQHL